MLRNTQGNGNFSFKISLSVLNHLGRNLYRSFITILGEAISNSWDADASNVWIEVNQKNNSMMIVDDGIGMTADDFQNKFLKIGYSKRGEGKQLSSLGRPFIGRKGIGKLALISCAKRISIFSKVQGQNFIGGVIDNSGLDQAITQDLEPQEYVLGEIDISEVPEKFQYLQKGTILIFDEINEGINHSIEFIKKTVALFFRFSLIDEKFRIFLNDKKITYKALNKLASKTEFIWQINEIKDPFINYVISEHFTEDENEFVKLEQPESIKGFIASVKKPLDKNIFGTGEKIGIDLFVNGRLRERDLLKHIPTSRVVESYVYGQIHYDELNDDKDRFTSSREGVVSNDDKFEKLLGILSNDIFAKILKDWDEFRIKHRKEGDPDNETILKRSERKAIEMFDIQSPPFLPRKHNEEKSSVDNWVDSLREDAKYNFPAYADCFISENLLRNYIDSKNLPLNDNAIHEIEKYKRMEINHKNQGNVHIDIRESFPDTLTFLDMEQLCLIINPDKTRHDSIYTESKPYRPIRDALMHTARLTTEAKTKLRSIHDNLKSRIKHLLKDNQ